MVQITKIFTYPFKGFLTAACLRGKKKGNLFLRTVCGAFFIIIINSIGAKGEERNSSQFKIFHLALGRLVV